MMLTMLLLCSLAVASPVFEGPGPDTKLSRTKSKKNIQAFSLPIGKLWVNPTVWKKNIDANVPGAALELSHNEGDAFLAVVSNPDFMPANDFIVAFVDGMSSGDSEVKNSKLTKRRSLRVNGHPVTDITITAQVSNQPFVYRGYLYTGRQGVCLILTWTHAELYNELTADIEQALDGYVVK